MTDKNIKLKALSDDERNRFILDNQRAFKYGVIEAGLESEQFEKDGEIIDRETIERSIDNGQAYRIMFNNCVVGGLVISTNGESGELELLFVNPEYHNKGLGYDAWCEVERIHPEIKVWRTVTPYFEKRNIYFYVNKCKFHIIEFFKDMGDFDDNNIDNNGMNEGMLRFEKRIDEKEPVEEETD